MNNFVVNEQLLKNSHYLTDGLISKIYLKNTADFPWLILVPQQESVEEIYQLSEENQRLLWQEVGLLSALMQELFKADKMNIGALGNMVSQFHFHIVARYKNDPAWPYSVWQASIKDKPFSTDLLEQIAGPLIKQIKGCFHEI